MTIRNAVWCAAMCVHSESSPRHALKVAALVVLAMTNMGCSVIGFSAGAIKDARKPDTISLTAVKVLALKPNSDLSASHRDGTTVVGKFAGPVTESGSAYGPAFAAKRERLLPDYSIPALGSFVQIGTGLRERSQPSRVPDVLLGWNQEFVFLKNRRSAWAVRWADVPSLTTLRTGSIEGVVLEELTATGQIPSVEGIAIRTSESDAAAPILFFDVHEYQVRPSRNAKWKGLVGGAVLDGLLVGLIYAAVSSIEVEFGNQWPYSSPP